MIIDEGTKPEVNMGTSTITRINDIFKEIKDISIKTELHPNNQNFLSKGRGQHMKLNLMRDLFVQSVPFLPIAEVETFKKRIQEIKPKFRLMEYLHCGNTIKQNIPTFSRELENTLDDFMIDLQVKLQEKDFFNPTNKGERI